jgi:hypothetical protein
MEEFTKIETLIDHAREYVNNRIDEARLKAAGKASGVLALLVADAVVRLVFVFSLFFASVAGAYGLGIWLGKMWLGFLLVSGVYFLAGCIAWATKERLIRIPVMNAVIYQLFKKDDPDEED